MYVDLSYNRLAGLYSRCLASLQIILNLVYLRSEAKNGRGRQGGREVEASKQVTFYWATRRMSYTHRNSNKFK